ncbi:MAG: glycosyltransferase [Lachnospiraceae bacterium]|nr:glycosyltransferase [Lachnospiraceae bacterium]
MRYFEDILTILIPTYNRQEGLKNTLAALENQTCKKFKIIISDNASDYDTQKTIDNMSKEFQEKCTVIRRKINVGINVNISEIFSYCNSKWAWTLSDDDQVMENAVEKIYDAISKYEGAAVFNFVHFEDWKEESDIIISDIKKFVEFYEEKEKNNSLWHGDMIFYSNKVYNMELIQDYLGETIFYSYSYLPSLIILTRCLESTKNYVMINEQIVKKSVAFINGVGWNFYKAYLASRIMLDIQINVDDELRMRLMKVMIFDIRDLLYTIFVLNSNEKPNVNSNYFEILYHGSYKFFLPPKQKLLLWLIKNIYKYDWGFVILKKIVATVMK